MENLKDFNINIGDKVKIILPGHEFHLKTGIYLGHDGTDSIPHMIEIDYERSYFEAEEFIIDQPVPLFRKSKLKTGMVLMSGYRKWTVLLDTDNGDIIACEGSSAWLSSHSDTHFFGDDSGKVGIIDAVLQPDTLRDYATMVNREYRVIWQKKKPMTVADIEKELGYEIQVVTEVEKG